MTTPDNNQEILNAKQQSDDGRMANANFGDLVGAGMDMGVPLFNPITMGKTISQVNTIFVNLRWYLISNMRQPLNEAYAELGLVQTIVDVPVDDALRGGVEIKSKQLSPEQIFELNIIMQEQDDLGVAGYCGKWNRLFGGAGLLILTDDDPETPLDIEKIPQDSNVNFVDCDLWELFWSVMNVENFDYVNIEPNFEFYDYYGVKVHRSRVVPLKGNRAPSMIRPRLRGWGMSVVEQMIREINQYLKSTDLIFEVLDEFKLDVYKFDGLANLLLAPNNQGKVAAQTRVAQTNLMKNYQNAVVMDSKDDFDHKQLTFAGIPEIMAQIRMQVASALRIPLTKLFGISAAGFNSGEDDIEVYNSMVEGSVRSKLRLVVLKQVQIRCQQLFGYIPDDLQIEFKPLRILSSEQEENVKTAQFNRLLQARQSGFISDEEFRDGVNKDDLLGVYLDKTDIESLDVNDESVGDEDSEGDGGDAKPSGKKSSAIPDTKKSALTAKESKEAKNSIEEDSLIADVKPYTPNQMRTRLLPNSPEFDRRSYEADGGDAWIDERRKHFFDDGRKYDETLWKRSQEASYRAFGEERWQFVVWMYKKLGGKL